MSSTSNISWFHFFSDFQTMHLAPSEKNAREFPLWPNYNCYKTPIKNQALQNIDLWNRHSIDPQHGIFLLIISPKTAFFENWGPNSPFQGHTQIYFAESMNKDLITSYYIISPIFHLHDWWFKLSIKSIIWAVPSSSFQGKKTLNPRKTPRRLRKRCSGMPSSFQRSAHLQWKLSQENGVSRGNMYRYWICMRMCVYIYVTHTHLHIQICSITCTHTHIYMYIPYDRTSTNIWI